VFCFTAIVVFSIYQRRLIYGNLQWTQHHSCQSIKKVVVGV